MHDDPQFIVSCYLPAGWVRVRFRIHVPARRRSSSTPSGTATLAPIETGPVQPRPRRRRGGFPAPRRPTPVRIDPLDSPGYFRIDRFDVTPRPGPIAIADALRRKLRLLRAYRNTGPVLRRGLQLLLPAAGAKSGANGAWACTIPLHEHGFFEPEKAYEKWVERRRADRRRSCSTAAWAEDLDDPPRISS